MERAVQIFAVVHFLIIGLSHIVPPDVVFLKNKEVGACADPGEGMI